MEPFDQDAGWWLADPHDPGASPGGSDGGEGRPLEAAAEGEGGSASGDGDGDASPSPQTTALDASQADPGIHIHTEAGPCSPLSPEPACGEEASGEAGWEEGSSGGEGGEGGDAADADWGAGGGAEAEEGGAVAAPGQETVEARQRWELLGLALQEARCSLLGALGAAAFGALYTRVAAAVESDAADGAWSSDRFAWQMVQLVYLEQERERCRAPACLPA